MTVTKVPSRRFDIDEYTCDECKRTAQVRGGDEPPWPWRAIPNPPGWIGSFHACCDGCQHLILKRHSTTPPPASPES